MDDVFLNKIRQSILEHIEDEKFSVAKLASEIGLSRSQLLRKIKNLTGKSANQFIRDIRLDEAVKLLRNTEYSTSEISYRVGFSSPSYFNKCFLDRFNYTPGEFKNLSEETISESSNSAKVSKKSYKKPTKIALYFVVVCLLIAVGYRFSKNSNVKNNTSKFQNASIAVLPFLDLSKNKDQEYLVDGFTEAITLELSKQSALRVIGRTSSMSFKGKKDRCSEIAKELGVKFLMEGSILFGSDSILVTVQLIEPFPEERHIWAKSYNQKRTVENELHLVENISTAIVNEINIMFTPTKKNLTDYIVDPNAYDLYLKGIHLWHQQSEKSISLSIDCFEKSIELDARFAPSYVALAEAYIALNKYIKDNEVKLLNREKSRKAVDKALVLDNTLGSAFITKGHMLGDFDWDWEAMKTMIDKGLELDPNNAYGHMSLSYYYLVNSNFDYAITEALIAEKLDPLNPMIATLVGERYCMANNFEKSIQQYNKVLELFPDYWSALQGLGFVQFLDGQIETSKNTFLRLQQIFGNDSMINAYNEKTYKDALDYWLADVKGENPQFCSFPTLIARVEMMVNDKQEALKYLEIAFKYREENLPKMLLWPHFNVLRNETRFKEITKKTGVIINTGFPSNEIKHQLKQ